MYFEVFFLQQIKLHVILTLSAIASDNFVCIVRYKCTGFATFLHCITTVLSPYESLFLFLDHDRARDLGHAHAQDHARDHGHVQSRQCSSLTEVLVEVPLHQVSSEC